jgi:hypothetical protein
LAEYQILDANVFVQIGPMNSLSGADPSEIVSLIGRAMLKARIPSQRNSYGTAITQIDNQAVICDSEVLCPNFSD